MHGGQSPAGTGDFATMSDTWRFDLTTSVWTPYSADPDAPSVADTMAISVTDSTALVYGGRSDTGNLFGQAMLFDSAKWSRLLPAGDRPVGRSGHLVAYDAEQGWMMVSHGMDWTGRLLSDSWVLDLTRGIWSCVGGSASDHPACNKAGQWGQAGPTARGLTPPPMAFSAFAKLGVRIVSFGG